MQFAIRPADSEMCMDAFQVWGEVGGCLCGQAAIEAASPAEWSWSELEAEAFVFGMQQLVGTVLLGCVWGVSGDR